MKKREVRPVLLKINYYLFFLCVFLISGCGLVPGKLNQEAERTSISWEQLCFGPQGRARLSQGSEKNLAFLEGQFRPQEKKWAIAFSAPIYGERIFRLDWADGKIELSSADLDALGQDQRQKSAVLEMAKFMASVLQSSVDKKCDLSFNPGQTVGKCLAPLPTLPPFQFTQTKDGIEFSYETQRQQKVVWSHIVSGGTGGVSGRQMISIYQNNDRNVSPEWSLELFLSRCGENEPVQNP